MKAAFFVIPLVLVSALMAWQSQQRPAAASLASPRLEKAALDCKQPPQYRVGYTSDPAALIPQNQGFRFQGVAWLETDLCTPGTLTIRADGEEAGGAAPTLAVTLNSESLANLDIPAGEKTYSVRIPEAGRLTLGYFNDYYLADVRVATLEKFKFLGTGCQAVQVNVPEATGGDWNQEYKIANLVTSVPMTVTPCAAGELELQVVGREGNGAFPVLSFKQGDKVLQTLTTTQKRQRVKLTLSASPLTITLTNPYGRTVADRNLNLRNLEFTPAAPTSP
ncbi:hypothetical protein WDJ50_07680 [Deinococcus sp. VB142]|uniref:Uncharacterized protein n=1 Tax=Deinococcus sp. VB142 TaxID=3112952 RepID=A0AAU6PYI1_9DEIO